MTDFRTLAERDRRAAADDFFGKLEQRVLDQIDFAVLEQRVLTMHSPSCAITRLEACDCGAEGMLTSLGTGRDPYCVFCRKRHPGGDRCMGHHP